MYSMNYIGKFIANFREFYNEINSATLTGAIDVVVVEQPDGSFNCSPFHVRFGKLGVLRSRFKVVDLELNGEPLDIHMKLGESGEAFFVEEIGDNEPSCSAHLATSPIPAGHFEEMYEPRRRNSLSAVEPDHGQASDYTKRRYTADAQSMKKPDPMRLTGTSIEKKPEAKIDDSEALFDMEGLDDEQADGRMPKTFSATKLGEAESEANQVVQKISAHNDFRPIDVPSQDDKNGNAKKKKKVRKVSSKKKHQRKSSTSSISSLSDRAGLEQKTQPNSISKSVENNFFSDSEVNAAAFSVSRQGTPVQSDTEMELARASGGDKSSQSWRWGELPEPPLRGEQSLDEPDSPVEPASPAEPASPVEPLSSDEERPNRRGMLSGMFRFMAAKDASVAGYSGGGGVYLDDLDRGQVDRDLYFPKHHADRYRSENRNIVANAGPSEEEYESGNGPSLPQSPVSIDHANDSDEELLTKLRDDVGVFVREDQVSRALSFEEFCERYDSLNNDGALVIRLGDRWLSWKQAQPLILCLLAYRRPLPSRVLEALEKGSDKEGSRASDTKPRSYSWWSWRRSNVADNVAKLDDMTSSKDKSSTTPGPLEVQTEARPAEESVPTESVTEAIEMKEVHIVLDTQPHEVVDTSVHISIEPQIAPELSPRHEHSSSESDQEDPTHRRPSRRHSSFRKTLRLSSDQIKKLNLKDGMNEMVFSVTTAYQGTTRCKCNVFRWRFDDKIVISDIDGTITKSDVLGHIFPMVGKDWAQAGVAQLFTKIKNNGYQLLYLSARAIGQARVTREYLRSIRQGEVCLPDGPLLLNPTSLLRAFHREVIEKKPEEFKIQCLSDIKALFPPGSNPFYAGYGNRVNDVCAYQAVGIPIVRIFTINYKGELKHELTQTFQSTYSHMSVMVDQVFPPCLCEPSDEFSQTVFWREPLPSITLPLAPQPAAKPPK